MRCSVCAYGDCVKEEDAAGNGAGSVAAKDRGAAPAVATRDLVDFLRSKTGARTVRPSPVHTVFSPGCRVLEGCGREEESRVLSHLSMWLHHAEDAVCIVEEWVCV